VLLGRLKAPTQHSTHIFAVAGTASQFLYRNRKNVSYRQTLYEIWAGIGLKIVYKIIVDKNILFDKIDL